MYILSHFFDSQYEIFGTDQDYQINNIGNALLDLTDPNRTSGGDNQKFTQLQKRGNNS